jgi:hypothetical protein
MQENKTREMILPRQSEEWLHAATASLETCQRINVQTIAQRSTRIRTTRKHPVLGTNQMYRWAVTYRERATRTGIPAKGH